jgi:hypothetical protein
LPKILEEQTIQQKTELNNQLQKKKIKNKNKRKRWHLISDLDLRA